MSTARQTVISPDAIITEQMAELSFWRNHSMLLQNELLAEKAKVKELTAKLNKDETK